MLQVVLCAAAAVAAIAEIVRLRRVAEPVAFDIIVAAALVIIVIGEIDLDRRLFGTKIIHTWFFVDGAVWLPYRVLAVVVVVGAPATLAVYALAHLGQIWRAGLRALGAPWGQILVAGVVLFALAEIFERPLGRVAVLPRYFGEEALEFLASECFLVALVMRPALRRRRAAA